MPSRHDPEPAIPLRTARAISPWQGVALARTAKRLERDARSSTAEAMGVGRRGSSECGTQLVG